MNIQHQNTIEETENNRQRKTHPQSELEVGIRDISQQQKDERIFNALHLWHLPKTTHELDHRRKKKIS
jgi:hypothetical protein